MPEEPVKHQESTSVHKTGQVSSGLIDASFCSFYVGLFIVTCKQTIAQ